VSLPPAVPVLRGRHAPPREVRQDQQRARLFAAASVVFARGGHAEASAEAIAREAGMSKATFYEHFDNKDDCLLALLDFALAGAIAELERLCDLHAERSPAERLRSTAVEFLKVVAAHPEIAQTVLFEVVGAGPRVRARRDEALEAIAAQIHARTGELVSIDDAFAIVAAVVGLVGRQLRRGRPATMEELDPVIGRLAVGLMCSDA
jgi:AcrR family transcriptional regulator